jgi:seryl-tRNA synthetase
MDANRQPCFVAKDGLTTLGPQAMRIMELLDDCFLAWARRSRAEPMLYPTLIPVSELGQMDYFKNFPHLGLFVSNIEESIIKKEYQQDDRVARPAGVPAEHLCCSGFALPSAACYNIYVSLKNSQLDGTLLITTAANCYRNEAYYEGLKRLKSFRMREVVAVGEIDDVRAHLVASRAFLDEFATALDLPLDIKTATDPFFDVDGPRATMQRRFPVKEEFVFDGKVAIASLNFHRNFFGERFAIRKRDGEYAHSGCVGMGLERWIHALLERYGEDCPAIEAKLRAQLDTIGAAREPSAENERIWGHGVLRA